jgi:1-acyl-sn-glycerol-3-phosphate acyltransferase
MSLAFRTVTGSIKGLTRILCRVDDESLARVPPHGPLILVCNHINFLEVPLTFTHLQPRPVTGFAKSETWDNPMMGPLFTLWDAIPIQRGAVDMAALRQGLAALEAGKIVAIAPEGTRSGHGRLQKGHPGVVSLAVHSKAPLLPLVYYGGERFHQNFRRLRRTDFYFNVGQPFYVEIGGVKLTRPFRQAITDEIMYQLALLLPPEYRGEYAYVESATTKFLRF